MKKIFIYIVLIILFINTSLVMAQSKDKEDVNFYLPEEKALLEANKFDQALTMFEKKYKEASSANDLRNKAKYLKLIGDAYIKKCTITYNLTFCSMGLAKYDDVFKMSDNIEDKVSVVNLLNRIGSAQKKQYYYTKSEQTFKKAIDIATQINDLSDLIKLNKNLGELYLQKNMYNDALALFQKAKDLIKQTGQNKYYEKVLNDEAKTYSAMGKFDKAKEIYTGILGMAGKENNVSLFADTLNNLAFCEINIGNYKNALEYYNQALNLYKQLKKRNKMIETNINMGELYITYQMNTAGQDFYSLSTDLNKALSHFNNALSLAKESSSLELPPDNKKYDNTMTEMSDRLMIFQKVYSSNYTKKTIDMETLTRATIGTFKVLYLIMNPLMEDCQQMTCKDFKPSDAYRLKAFSKWDKLNNKKEVNTMCTNTKSIFKKLLWVQIISLNEMVKEMLKRGSIKEVAELYQYYAFSYKSMGQYDKAILYINKIIDIKKNTASSDLWYYYYMLGGNYTKMNKNQEALSAYQTAVDLVLDISHNISNEKDKLAYLDKKRLLFKDYAELKKQMGDVAGAMEILDLANLSEQADYLTSKKTELKGAAQSEKVKLTQKAIETKTRAASIANEIALESEKPPENQDKGKIDSLKNQLQQARADFQKTALQIQQDFPDLLKYVAIKPSNIRTIQHALPPDCILIQPVILNDKIIIFLAPSGDKAASYKELNVSSNEVFQNILSFRKSLINIDDKSQVLKASTNLYNLIIKPIEADIAPYKTLVICPYENLRYIPFQALYDGKNYLIEKYAIVNLSSSSSLKVADQKPVKVTKLLAFGNASEDLPAAEKEVNDIKKNFKDSKLFVRKQALRDVFDQEIYNDFNVVHLATHGILNSDEPDKSRLVFAGNANNALSVSDILAYDFSNKDLIVLSACDSNVGKAKGAEVMSLGSAFEMAAAPSVIATLWKVNDESTSLLMNAFYVNLAKGESKAESLRNAQITLIHSDKYNNPYYWSPFVLLGEWK